jgi:hypothetical protein
MPLTFQEETKLREAFSAIERERRESLRAMFNDTHLRPKSRVEDAKTLAKSAKDAKKSLAAIPGVGVPDLSLPDMNLPSLNLNLFKGWTCGSWWISPCRASRFPTLTST